MSEPALQVSDIGYRYNQHGPMALDGVSFEVAAGSFTALLGPNGAGKTTLMALVTRLFASRTGSINICGHELSKSPRQALASIGVVFQRPTLDLDLSVEQNLAYASNLYGLSGSVARQRIKANVERLEIDNKRNEKVRNLSGGMRRRVELARALLHQPKLLVLDEPTVGLDIPSRQAITGYVHRLAQEQGISALWTTHLIDEIEDGDDVVMLAAGTVRAKGKVRDCTADYGSDLERAYEAICGAANSTQH